MTDLGGGLDWGPDGWLYVSGLDGLARVSPRGGRLERVTSIDAKRGDLRHIWPAVLPGGRAALVTIFSVRKSSNPERASIGLADFATGKVDVLLRGVRAIYSPTGHVVFAKANGVLWAAPFDVRTLRLTGRERELADTVATADLSLSPGGTLAYIKGVVQSVQAMWVDRNGVARPVAPDLKDFRVLDPALSPDGKRLIVVMAGIDGKRHLWLKPVDGGPRSRLTFDGTQNFRPAWRPGTSAFTFSSDREAAGGKYWLFESDADGTARVRKPELRDPRAIATSTWSPDGKWLVFRTDNQEPGNGDIMAIRPGVDTVARALVATPAEELSPAVSFDGRWLAYSSNESGRQEVYVRPFPEASSARFQVSSASGINPAWNRNGKELFYLDAAYSMIAVPVTTGATFKSGSPQVLFSAAQYISNPFARQYDVMPDGKRFVMLGGEADRTVHVVVVFNFLEELKRRMAAP